MKNRILDPIIFTFTNMLHISGVLSKPYDDYGLCTRPAFKRQSKMHHIKTFVVLLLGSIYSSRKVLFCRTETFLALQLRHSFFSIHKILNIKFYKYTTYYQPKQYPTHY